MLTGPTRCRLNGDGVATKSNRPVLLVLGCGIVAALIFLLSQDGVQQFWQERFGFGRVDGAVVVASTTMESVDPPQKSVVPPLLQKDSLSDNECGVNLVLKKKYWEGLYSFRKAIENDPSKIAPLINMAVVLTTLELPYVAEKYLAMARSIDLDHPGLKKNFDVEATHLIDEK